MKVTDIRLADVLMEALQLLEGNPQIKEVARKALNDPDPYVHGMAEEILQRMVEVEESHLPFNGYEENYQEMENENMDEDVDE